MTVDDAPPTLGPADAFPDVMADLAVRRRRDEVSARLFGTGERLTRIGRYRVGRRLGSGAIGVVHLAHDDLLGRDVAIKLLRTRGDANEAEARRAVREAQALARLSHPNVVAVFATGIDAGHGFIAMELVHGSTLRAWQTDRPWRDVLAAYAQAGRGLAAAHAAGIVHRDFKPDNAMIDPDGRVRVLDFGLARGVAAIPEAVPSAVVESSDALERSATAAGALVGTPAYMAPEQLSGTGADARSDQFAFCVALFEALWGERPFVGGTPARLLESQLAEAVRARPARSSVPSRVHEVLRRGLRCDPDARWPSMHACLDALQRAARPWSPRLSTMAGLVVGSAVAAAFVLRSAPAADCTGGRDRVAGIWDDTRRAELDASLGESTRHLDRMAWSGARTRLDAYAEQWVDVWSRACSDAEGEALVAQMQCLERRRHRLAATIDAMVAAQPLNARVAALLGGLEPIEPCLDANGGGVAPERPEDPARAEAVDAVERDMVVAHTQIVAGRLDRGVHDYERALERARELDWPPLLAHALYWTAAANHQLERNARARELYEEGYAIAHAIRRDDLVALTATHMTMLAGYEESKPGEAERWASLGEAAIDRIGRPNRIEADLHNNLGLVRMRQGDHERARASYMRAIAIYEQVGGEQAAAIPLQNLAQIAYVAGDFEEAENLLDRALALRGDDDDHPDMFSTLANRGIVRTDRGRLDEAEDDLQRALAIAERSLGPDSPSRAAALSNLGTLAAARGDWDASLEHFRNATATFARGIGRDNEEAAHALAGAGAALVQLGRVDEGDALLVQALVELESLYGSDHEEVGDAALDLGSARLSAGRAADAVPSLRRAADIFARTDGANALRVARARAEVGRALLATGRIGEAVDELEWALGVLQAYTLPPAATARVRLALARALAARGRRYAAEADEERISTLARAAADGFRSAGALHRDDLAAAEALLSR